MITSPGALTNLPNQTITNTGDAQAALRLGESYDPSLLARARLAGMRGELAKAAYWYRYARGLGLPEANVLLGQLEIK